MTAKGQGGGGCCCGGCHSPPTDVRLPTTGAVVPQQHYCCRCIPKFLCLTLIHPGYAGDAFSILLDRACDGNYQGDAIQYKGRIDTLDGPMSVIVRLAVIDSLCYLVFEIEETGESGRKLIDHNIPVEDPDCLLGMKTRDCVKFEAEWALYDGSIIRLAPADTFDVSSKIRCSGCSCLCRCLCFSVASQAPNGDITIVGTNEIVCVDVEEFDLENCSKSKSRTIRSAEWTRSGWSVVLRGENRYSPQSREVESGIEVPFEPCLLEQILRFVEDGEFHQVNSENGECSVIYETQIEEKTPLEFNWRGRSNGSDSVVEFEVYDWAADEWSAMGTVSGRPEETTHNRRFRSSLKIEHVGSGLYFGLVKIRVKSPNCTRIITDFFEIMTNSCCELELVPPPSVSPIGEIEKFDLSQNCQDPFKFWQIEDYDGTIWYVAIDCAWCGSTCGTTSTSCCPAPVSRILFAEVTIDCPGCSNASFSVPLVSSAGSSIWEGSGTHCNFPFTISLSCSGPGWIISALGAGACSYSGQADTVDCSPFFLQFSGRFGGGIGCCGVGSMDTDVAISITVVE